MPLKHPSSRSAENLGQLWILLHRRLPSGNLKWVWVNTYRYIFSGNEHPFTSYFDVHQGYKVLTHCQIDREMAHLQLIYL